MEATPQDFYEFIQNHAYGNDFRIVVNGQWCSFIHEQIDSYCNPSKNEHSIVIKGVLHPENEILDVRPAPTAVIMGGISIPCEIIGYDFVYESLYEQSIDGHHHIHLSICIQYSSYAYRSGAISDAKGEIPKEVEYIIEIKDDPKKKTFFDWIDLE